MYKYLLLAVTLFSVVHSEVSQAATGSVPKFEGVCAVLPPEGKIINTGWPDMEKECLDKVKNHISMELSASMTYIAMGAHFLNAANFRPGMAKMVLKHAGEERQHAKMLMDYLSMRGYNVTKEQFGQGSLKPAAITWESVYAALTTTLKIEKDVRDEFKKIIRVCEEGEAERAAGTTYTNDYHISDFLAGNFLEEQHHGVREIAGLMSTLKRMLANHGNSNFAEFEFDRTLLEH